MKNNVSWAKALGAGGWTIVLVLLAFIITAIAAVGIEGWDWNLLTEVFENLWQVFVAILVVSTILVIFLYKYPLQILAFVLSAVAVLLIAAAYKGSLISESIRNYIDAKFDFTYIATGLAVAAVLFSFIGIYRTISPGNKGKTPKEEVAANEEPMVESSEYKAATEEAREVETYPLEIPEVEAPPERVPEPEPSIQEAPRVERPQVVGPEPETPKEVSKVETPPDVFPEPETPKPETPTYKGLTKEYNDLKLMDD